MRVECHPNFNIPPDEACVSVRPMQRGKHTYHMGTVTLSDVSFKIHEGGRQKSIAKQVKNVHAWVCGELLDEAVEQWPLSLSRMVMVFYHFNVGRFLTVDGDSGKVVDVTEGNFNAAYCVGRRLYISKEW